MKKNWIFTFNSFEVATEGSNKKMLSLSTDTDSKLADGGTTDPEIQALYDDFHPLYNAYRLICLAFAVAFGNRKGQTLDLVTMLKTDLPEELRIWEGKVRSVYPEDSPQEKAIFPNKRNPFLKGTYEQRVGAVGSLAEKLATDPAFATLAPQVQSYYNLLLAARNTQLQKEGRVSTISSEREEQRKVVARGMYVVLGKLMAKFAANTTQIDNYFDLSLIRHAENDAIPADMVIVRGKVTIDGVGFQGAVVKLGKVSEPVPQEKITDGDGNYEFTFENLEPVDVSEQVRLTVNVPAYAPFEEVFSVELGEEYIKNIALAQAMLRAA